MMFKGAKPLSQKRQNTNAPTSFYGALHGLQKCQLNGAPLGRAKGKIQKCQCPLTLPNQSQGVIIPSQKCYQGSAPNFLHGAAQGPQKCQPVGAPKGRASSSTQKCQHVFALPNQSHGAIFTPQQCQRMHAPSNLGHAVLAEMPNDCRPNNNDQRPPPLRRNAIAITPRN